MAVMQAWKTGDWVMHATKPEWGAGQVLNAEGHIQDGKRCQRLNIRFDRGGLKVLSTAFAELKPTAPGGTAALLSEGRDEDFSAPALDLASLREALEMIPEAATDPFISIAKRYESTLGLYRFTGQGGSLLDWATSQTRLKDPLSSFSRHELEQYFQKFRIKLDTHLKQIRRDIQKQDPGAAMKIEMAASPAARQLLQRLSGGR